MSTVSRPGRSGPQSRAGTQSITDAKRCHDSVEHISIFEETEKEYGDGTTKHYEQNCTSKDQITLIWPLLIIEKETATEMSTAQT